MGTGACGLFSTVLIAVTMLLASCGGDGDPRSADEPTGDVPTFDGVLTCPDGENVGGMGWDYGPDVQGSIDDPVAWVHDNGRGLDEDLTLSFLATAGERDDGSSSSSSTSASSRRVPTSRSKAKRVPPPASKTSTRGSPPGRQPLLAMSQAR